MNKKNLLFYLATKLTWLIILFFGKIGRVGVRNRHYWNRLVKSGQGFLIIVWHGKMLLPIHIHRKLGIHAMISEHADGEIIARTVERLGYKTIRGSSTRGGRKAFKKMLRALKQNHICAIMPDGPKGPRHEFKSGALLLAARSDAYMLPMTFAASKPIIMKSWDHFTLWWPFSKVCMIYGKPTKVSPNMSQYELEAVRKRVESALVALEKEADEVFRK